MKNTILSVIMASTYSNWSLQKCNQHFDRHFQKFENWPISNRRMSNLQHDGDKWIRFQFQNFDHSPNGCALAALIHSLNLKIWYRLNKNQSRGEVCISHIHDKIRSKESPRTSAATGKESSFMRYISHL